MTELRPLYRGYMTVPSQKANNGQFVVSMQAENFAGLLADAQNRTYQNSTLWDASDQSGAASRGMSGTVPGAPGGGGGGRSFDADARYYQQ